MPFGNSRVVSRTTVPDGHRDSSPAFQRREGPRKNLSPDGTVERARGHATFQSSLGDLFWCGMHPGVETLFSVGPPEHSLPNFRKTLELDHILRFAAEKSADIGHGNLHQSRPGRAGCPG